MKYCQLLCRRLWAYQRSHHYHYFRFPKEENTEFKTWGWMCRSSCHLFIRPVPGGRGGGGTSILTMTGTCRWTGYDFAVINIGTGYLNRPIWLLADYSVYHMVTFQPPMFMTGPGSRHQRRCVRDATNFYECMMIHSRTESPSVPVQDMHMEVFSKVYYDRVYIFVRRAVWDRVRFTPPPPPSGTGRPVERWVPVAPEHSEQTKLGGRASHWSQTMAAPPPPKPLSPQSVPAPLFYYGTRAVFRVRRLQSVNKLLWVRRVHLGNDVMTMTTNKSTGVALEDYVLLVGE